MHAIPPVFYSAYIHLALGDVLIILKLLVKVLHHPQYTTLLTSTIPFYFHIPHNVRCLRCEINTEFNYVRCLRCESQKEFKKIIRV